MSLVLFLHDACTPDSMVLSVAVHSGSSSTLSSGTTDDTEACPARLPESGVQDRDEDVYRTEPDKDDVRHGPCTERSMPEDIPHDNPTPILQ